MKYSWPYEQPPYPIQVELMEAIRSALEQKQCGVFESPTGTGKSRSIICSVIPWLMANLEKTKAETAEDNSSEPSWLHEFAKEQSTSNLKRVDQLRKQREDRIAKRPKLAVADRKEEEGEEIGLERMDEAEAFTGLRKVYYCSRTHTQLSQFANEVRKINQLLPQPVSLVVLGSRQQLCIHEEIKQKPSHVLNDACLDLNDTKAKCPYNNSSGRVEWLADYALQTSIPDLEDLSSHDTCPYYASRQASTMAQVVLLPYTSLLNPDTREALGLNLEASVIVFDEAHNLVDAIADAYTTAITLGQLQTAIEDITHYVEKYSKLHLDTRNVLLQLSQLIMPKLVRLLSQRDNDKAEERMYTVDEFLQAVKLQDVNFLPLLAQAKLLKLNRKLKAVSNSQITILAVIAFLHSLTEQSDAGEGSRVKLTPGMSIKFLLLDISSKFTDIVSQAHSVLLCGGTMHPVDQIISQLFPTNAKQVARFSCGHVIPDNNLQVLQITKSPLGRELRFTHDHLLYQDLQACLRNLCAVSPQGMVVFFPSYAMLDKFIASLAGQQFKKPLIVETRRKDDDAFAEYELAVKTNTGGAMLLAVVGGRLSEGINFSDALARCVVMVGLPFPNRYECETQAKMQFQDQKFGLGAGHRYLENQCWKQVNQSVGRAIRHQNDFAMVVLLDVRFSDAQPKMPKWIANQFTHPVDDWGVIMRLTMQFFKNKSLSL
ncbi:hypothetical protein BASA81_010732 [Batrachochytrium salamandrivorans]|nr:hypothetical protein BASA81_010732 [Batrachochytrium salamandrivorans]